MLLLLENREITESKGKDWGLLCSAWNRERLLQEEVHRRYSSSVRYEKKGGILVKDHPREKRSYNYCHCQQKWWPSTVEWCLRNHLCKGMVYRPRVLHFKVSNLQFIFVKYIIGGVICKLWGEYDNVLLFASVEL